MSQNYTPDPVDSAEAELPPLPPIPADPSSAKSRTKAPGSRRYGLGFFLVVLPIVLCASSPALALGARLVVKNFKVEGSAMSPTLPSGVYVLVSPLAYLGPGDPQRGDIVVFKSWTPGKDFIKRVVGLPGETVEILDGELLIDGEVLDEPYLDPDLSGPAGSNQTMPLGENQFYVLGDNRGNSSDSRNHGPLPGDQLIGEAWFVYWPPDQFGFIRNDGP